MSIKNAEAASPLRRTLYCNESVFVGDEIKDRNRKQLALLINCWLVLLDDSPCDPHKPSRLKKRFLYQFIEDPKGTILKMSALEDKLLRSLDTRYGHVTMRWISDFMDTPIFREYCIFFRTRDPKVLQFILSYLGYGKKALFEDPDLIPTAFRKWEQIEDNMRGTFDRTLYVKVLTEVLRVFFPKIHDTTMLPVHGSGVVAERGIGKSSVAKNNNIGYSPMIDRALVLRHGNDPRRLFVSWDAKGKPSQTTSKLFFVPKTIKTARSICFEPITFMMAQQAVRLLVEDAIKKSPFRHHIFIDDQEVNRSAARYGSETGRVDTIDLSNASDSVAWGLIREIFPTKVRYYLQATRTREVELPNGQMRPLKKFAPMGSALCFPTQCLIYAAVVVSASILWGITVGRLRSYSDPLTAFHSISRKNLSESLDDLEPFYVYGDDIICDVRVTKYVIDILKALDFSVNEDKSFLGTSPFRESCGGFYFNGADVSPLRYRMPREDGGIDAQFLASAIDHVNLVGDYGYRNLHSFLLRYVLELNIPRVRKRNGKNPILFSEERNTPPFAIFSTNPINGHLERREVAWLGHDVACQCEGCNARWNRFQRPYVKCLRPIVSDRENTTIDHDTYHYVQWQRGKYGQNPGTPLPIGRGRSSFVPLEAGVGWGWMPA